MAKEKAESDKRGWFARWRERRTRSKQRAGEMTNRLHEDRNRVAERGWRAGAGPGSLGG